MGLSWSLSICTGAGNSAGLVLRTSPFIQSQFLRVSHAFSSFSFAHTGVAPPRRPWTAWTVISCCPCYAALHVLRLQIAIAILIMQESLTFSSHQSFFAACYGRNFGGSVVGKEPLVRDRWHIFPRAVKRVLLALQVLLNPRQTPKIGHYNRPADLHKSRSGMKP